VGGRVFSCKGYRFCLFVRLFFLLDLGNVPKVWYLGTVPTVWYLGTVPTVWYLGTVPTVWYLGTVPTVWYLGTVPTVWYLGTVPTVWYLGTVPTAWYLCFVFHFTTSSGLLERLCLEFRVLELWNSQKNNKRFHFIVSK